jgi:hypothetical protein
MDVSYTDGTSETVSASLSFRFDGIPELYFWRVSTSGSLELQDTMLKGRTGQHK